MGAVYRGCFTNHTNTLSRGDTSVLSGQDALRMQDSLDPLNHDMVLLEHPVKALLMNRNWKHKNIFNYLDRVTNLIFDKKIDWYA